MSIQTTDERLKSLEERVLELESGFKKKIDDWMSLLMKENSSCLKENSRLLSENTDLRIAAMEAAKNAASRGRH